MNINTLIKGHLKKQIALQKKLIKETEKHIATAKDQTATKYLDRLSKDLKDFQKQLDSRTEIAWNY